MTVSLYDVYHLFCLNHNLKYNQYVAALYVLSGLYWRDMNQSEIHSTNFLQT